MKYIEIGENRIPRLGLGTWQLKDEDCIESVKKAIENGYTHIDTAQVYGNERQVGKGIDQAEVEREDIWLTTKLWRDNLEPGRIRESMEESLDKLGTDYVDLVLIHWPFPELELEKAIEKMDELVDDGLAKNIGVSNFTAEQMKKADEFSRHGILTNQVEYHPFLAQDEIMDVCKRNDIMLTAYSPLARGDVIDNPTLKEIGDRHGKSAVQVSLRWLIQQNKVSAIPKAT